MALPKKHRLARRKDFEKVFKLGRTVKNGFLFIKFLKNDINFNRFGVVVSSKILLDSLIFLETMVFGSGISLAK